MKQLLLIRHGQASLLAADYDRLSERGVAQSASLGRALAARGIVPDRLFAGAMRRHRETADACLAAMGIGSPPEIVRGFDEYDHVEIVRRFEPRYAEHAAMLADLEAQPNPRLAFVEMFSDAVRRWTGGAHDADYAEDWPGFNARVARALHAAVASLPEDGTGVVFTSGGAIAASCRAVLELSTASTIDVMRALGNGGVTRFVQRRGRLTLAGLNDVSHLERDGLTSEV